MLKMEMIPAFRSAFENSDDQQELTTLVRNGLSTPSLISEGSLAYLLDPTRRFEEDRPE